jgi:hypothetical protein
VHIPVVLFVKYIALQRHTFVVFKYIAFASTQLQTPPPIVGAFDFTGGHVAQIPLVSYTLGNGH